MDDKAKGLIKFKPMRHYSEEFPDDSADRTNICQQYLEVSYKGFTEK